MRQQPPVHSPLDAGALAAGIRAALTRDDRSLAAVRTELQEKYDAGAVLLTDSGTSALTLALSAARRRRSGPILLPAWSCYNLATAAEAADVDVVLYDLDPVTLAPDLDSVDSALARKPSALIVAPLFGVPIRMLDFVERARDVGALLVEDAAQAAGARWNERPVGAMGDLSVLSFNRGKGTTGGGGGALLARGAKAGSLIAWADEDLQGPDPSTGARMVLAATAQWLLGRPSLYRFPVSLPMLALGESVYRPPSPPRRMPEGTAAILARTLGADDEERRTRRKHAERLARAVERCAELATVRLPEESRPGWLRFPVRALTESARERAETRRARELGVAVGYPRPLARLPGFGDRCANATGSFPGAETLACQLVTLPTHGLLEERDLTALERWISEMEPGTPRSLGAARSTGSESDAA